MSKKEHFENAMRKVNENDFESAIELFGEALKEGSNKETIYYNIAVSYLNLGKLDLAIFDFNKLIKIGEDVSEEVKLIDLGRRAIMTLKQNLIGKVNEHDNTNVFKKYKYF